MTPPTPARNCSTDPSRFVGERLPFAMKPFGPTLALAQSHWPALRRAAQTIGVLFFLMPAVSQGMIASGAELEKELKELNLSELQQGKEQAVTELTQLANLNLRGGVGTICFRSMPQPTAESAEWVQINLAQPSDIEEIVLVPAIWHDNASTYRDDGFPREFRIVAGSATDRVGALVASIQANEVILPRIAPLIIPVRLTQTAWIRLEAVRLSRRFHDNQYILQLSELMAFHGTENVALSATVTSSSAQLAGAGAYRLESLTDGFLPYLMDSATGPQSNPYLSSFDIGPHPTLTFDLGSPQELTAIRIHMIEQGDTVPHALQPDYGVPRHLVFEGASKADFSEPEILWDYQPTSLFEIAPIVTRRLPSRAFRYVRLRVLENFTSVAFSNSGEPMQGPRLGFAEIELLAHGRNAAKGIIPSASYDTAEDDPNRPLSRLTDGRTIFGDILPLREWMRQLSRRHELLFELPFTERAIDERIEHQKIVLQRWIRIAVVLAGLVVFIFLVDRILTQRAIFKTRVAIAADIHDEIGANLHAIALLGDLALAAKDSPAKAHGHIMRIRALSNRTGEATKHLTNILASPGLYGDLLTEIRRFSHRITSGMVHELILQGEEHLGGLSSRKRIHVILFYKECLVNIVRHADAMIARTQLVVTKDALRLTVSDNGHGLPVAADGPRVPPSLERRARLLRARARAGQSPLGGAEITLELKL